jgi:hypothetical protein
MPLSTFHEDIRGGRIAAFQIADANVHRILMLGLQAERRLPAAVEEVSQIVASETGHLFDLGLFSPQAAVTAHTNREDGRTSRKVRRTR